MISKNETNKDYVLHPYKKNRIHLCKTWRSHALDQELDGWQERDNVSGICPYGLLSIINTDKICLILHSCTEYIHNYTLLWFLLYFILLYSILSL